MIYLCSNNANSEVHMIMSPIQSALKKIYERHKENFGGAIASYIPELKKANPSHFGISLATVDGMIYEVGETRENFTLQSISKVFVYGMALADHGINHVLDYVGVEPHGDSFNSIIFNPLNNRPFNPMVNSGAISTTSLIKGDNKEHRLKRILEMFSSFMGHQALIDEKVFESERVTGNRNRAIAYLELSNDAICPPIDEHLELYFKQCSVLGNARDLAVMAATIAADGINPLTKERAQKAEHIHRILSIMQSCGMYDYSGSWMYHVGLPAKSGVSGGIMAVVPGLLGIGIYSPLLDERGNSVRGIAACRDFSREFNLHIFCSSPPVSSVIRRHYTGDQIWSKRLRNKKELEILRTRAHEIHVYELQGDLFFSSVEQICRNFSLTKEKISYVIFDGKHVSRIDKSSLGLIYDLKKMLDQQNIKLFIAGNNSFFFKVLKKEFGKVLEEHTFIPSIDQALQWCEDELIASSGLIKSEEETLPLDNFDIAQDLDATEIEVVKNIITPIDFGENAYIVKEGDEASEIFMLAKGLLDVFLLSDQKEKIRIASIGPGNTFGELGLFYGKKRTADIIAQEKSTCYVLPLSRFESLADTNPVIHGKLLRNVGRILSDRLRQADQEIRILSH